MEETWSKQRGPDDFTKCRYYREDKKDQWSKDKVHKQKECTLSNANAFFYINNIFKYKWSEFTRNAVDILFRKQNPVDF